MTSCGELGHLARQCPSAPSKGSGECFNCGQTGHMKSECTNEKVERPFSGDCHICGVSGHSARNCENKPPMTCRNCNNEGKSIKTIENQILLTTILLSGHVAKDCTAPRALNWEGVEEMSPEEAWSRLHNADSERDLDDFRQVIRYFYIKRSSLRTC